MRLFVALDLPDEIKSLVHPLQTAPINQAQWTNPANWHITLHFIGETQQYAAIHAALQIVEMQAFDLCLRSVGTFPEQGQPRILWAGIEESSSLQQLHQRVSAALQTTGYQPESRPYNPHLTLARFKKDKPDAGRLAHYLATHHGFQTPQFAITHFTLYASQLENDGVMYAPQEHYRLAN